MVEVKCPKCGTIKEIVGTEKRVRCYSNACTNRFYVNIDTIVPENRDNKDNIGTTDPPPTFSNEYKTTIKLAKASAQINLNPILKCMARGISTIENKTAAKNPKSGYFWDLKEWKEQFEILKKLKEEVEK